MTTDVNVNNLKINVLKKRQYDQITPSNDELYLLTDTNQQIEYLLTVAEEAPANPSDEDKYYNTISGKIFEYDGDNSQWVEFGIPVSEILYVDKLNQTTYVYTDDGRFIQVGSSGSANNVDEVTTELNQDEQIQAIGVIEKNSLTAKYDWIGTKAEYNALPQVYDNWLYYITDDQLDGGSTSLTNVYNRLNKAYAWTYKNITGNGSLYNIGYNNGSYFSSDASSSLYAIGDCASNFGYSNYIISGGKLYHKSISGSTITMTQVGSDTTWTWIAGVVDSCLGVNNSNLYFVNGTTATLKDEGGWQKISCGSSGSIFKSLGIKNDSLYILTSNGTSITLLDSTGVWTDIEGFFGDSNHTYYCFGIKDGKLYSVSKEGVINEVSSDTTWKMIAGQYTTGNFSFGIKNDALYAITHENSYLIDNTNTWIKCCGNSDRNGYAITSTGKLYKIRGNNPQSLSISQIGSDTTWTDISGNYDETFGVNNGNVYIDLSNPTQLTTIGGISKVYGCLSENNPSASYWTGSTTEDVHTVYTVPSPENGYIAYKSYQSKGLSTIITDVDENALTISDGTYTYTRDSSKDKIFEFVPDDSKNQLISVYDLLAAIKG